MSENRRSKVFNSFLWRFFERSGAKGVTFIVSLLLARILDPVVYGIIAIVMVFTNIMQVFIDSGLGNALIQKKDAESVDFSSVFYFNLITCFVLYAVMFFAAPFISVFYEMPELTSVIRVLSLSIVVSGIKNVQQAYVSKYLMFKKFFYATLGGTIVAAIVGIIMGLLGYGVWALVAQFLVNNCIDTLILWVLVDWRPTREFSFARLKDLLSYGWKILVSSLIDVVYTDLRSLVIGKIYSSSDLAFFNRGVQVPNIIVTTVNTSLDSVLLPIMSNVQDDIYRVKAMTRRAIKTSAYVIFPLMMGLAGCSTPLVRLVLTDKWLSCVPFLRMFCFAFMFHPIQTANLNAIKAIGRSDVFLKVELWKKVVGIIGLICTMYISVMAMGYSMIVIAFAGQIISSIPSEKLLGYSLKEQITDILPCGIISLLMGFAVYCVQFLNISDFLTLVIQVLLGVVLYVVGSKLFKLDSYSYILGLIKS